LNCDYNLYCRVPKGWGSYEADEHRRLAGGEGLRVDRESGNPVRIDVKGGRIKVWFDGNLIADVVDGRMGAEVNGQHLDHGGVTIG